MTLVRSIVLSAGVSMIGAFARADDVSRVTAVGDCAAGAPCIEMILHWDYARTDKPPIAATRADGSRVLRLRGRIGQERVRFHLLTVSAGNGGRKDDLGTVAYLGRSREGRPVIATDRGALAIETRGLVVGRGDGVVIIDARDGKIVRSLLGGVDGGTYVLRDADRVGVLSKGGACVSPPVARPGPVTAAGDCSGQSEPADGLAFSEPIIGAIATAPDADLALVRKLLPQTRDLGDAQLRPKIGRLDGRYIVVTPWD